MLPREQREHGLHELVHAPAALGMRHVHGRELLLVPADPHAEYRAAAADYVESRPFLGVVDRIAQWKRDPHGPDLDGPGHGREGARQHHWLQPRAHGGRTTCATGGVAW